MFILFITVVASCYFRTRNLEKSCLNEPFILYFEQEAELTGYYENEIKKQLKRQAAAHNELLDDKLRSQSELLTSEHQKTLDNEISKQQAIHFDELSRVAAHLKGVESVIDSVVDAASKNREAKELWVAVQSLGSVLSEEAANGRTRSLLPEMMSIHKLAGEYFQMSCIF